MPGRLHAALRRTGAGVPARLLHAPIGLLQPLRAFAKSRRIRISEGSGDFTPFAAGEKNQCTSCRLF
jgi:hypothetical protein